MTDRERDVAIAKSLIGKTADYFRPIWSDFASGYGWDGAWCSESACCVSYIAGTLGKIDISNYAYGLVQKFKASGRFGKSPALGAFIWFDYHDGNGPSHTGRVTGIDDRFVYTMEGNINGRVVSRRYALSDGYIYGYGYPAYEDIDMKFGIDLSRWNGDLDIEHARDYHGVEFVILKAGGGDDGLYTDSKFYANYTKAKKAGLPVGVYWYSKALTTSDAEKEAKYLLSILASGQYELPIYMDVEDSDMLGLGQDKLTSVVKTFCDILEKNKYFVGIYSTKNVFQTAMHDDQLQRYAHWIAYWGQTYNYDKKVGGLWQFGGETNYQRSNKINGVVCDQNYLFRDYTSAIKSRGLNGFAEPEPPKRFSDVPATHASINWAADNGIVSGYPDGTFRPDNPCTRAQFVTMIWRMAGKPEATRYVEFKDLIYFGSSKKAILWAAAEGLVKGYDSGYFNPDNNITRTQVALILWRWAGKPQPKDMNGYFKDVDKRLNNFRAIQWGYEAGVIKGYGDRTFRPNDNCTRVQAVTFLYRYAHK